jgi:hypothetical protein
MQMKLNTRNKLWSFDRNIIKVRLTNVEWKKSFFFNAHTKRICSDPSCHNPSLGLATKAKAYKDAGLEWSTRVTFRAPESVGECEGMNPHTTKWAAILGIRILMDSQIFRWRLQQSKLIGLKISLYHYKLLGT